jgi:hypothetical protein
MKKIILMAALSALLVGADTVPAKMPAVTVSASLSADPAAYVGPCPAAIVFRGKITASRPTTVQYRFIRSDGGMGPLQTLTFSTPGLRGVSTTWSLNHDITGWVAIKVVSPVAMESAKANFSIQCRLPNLAVIAFKYEGRLVNTANFPNDRPLTVRMDERKTIELTVQNAAGGADVTSEFSVGLYLSTAYPPGCRPAPIRLWRQEIPGLRSGESVRLSATILIPSTLSPIRYWLYPMVDDSECVAESVEDGNCYSAVPLRSLPR